MKGRSMSRAAANNRANQMNSNNAAYWASRGVAQPAATSASGSQAGQSSAATAPKEAQTQATPDSPKK